MATANTLTTLDDLMCELYPAEKVVNLATQESPFLQMVNKFTRVGGSSYEVGVISGTGGGGGAVIGNAITNGGTLGNAKFQVTMSDHFEVGVLNRRLVKQSLHNGSLIEVVKEVVDSKLLAANKALAAKAFGDGTGCIGRISTTEASVTDTTITLQDPDQVVNFEVGDVLIATSDKATARSGTVTLSGVDYNTGVLTASGNWDTGIAAVAAGDYLAKQGDIGAVCQGIAAWVPFTAPSSGESFLGVDRSTNSRLYGVYIDGRGEQLQHAINKGLAKVRRMGGNPDVIIMGAQHWVRLCDETSAQVQFTNPDGKGSGGFSFFNWFSFGGKPAKVICDPFVSDDRIELLTMKTWKLLSSGDAPEVQADEGYKFLRSTTADQYEFRVSAYYALACTAPAHNGTVQVDAEDL